VVVPSSRVPRAPAPLWSLALGLGFAFGFGGGCSFDSEPLGTTEGQLAAPIPLADPAGSESGGTDIFGNSGSGSSAGGGSGSSSGGTAGSGEVAPTPTPDAGTSTPSDTAADPAIAPTTTTTLPSVSAEPSGVLGRCVSDFGCQDGLRCDGSDPGYCTDSCSEDADCSAQGGVEFICADGLCRADCGEDGSEGACPATMICAPEGDAMFCRPPPEIGDMSRALAEACDLAHGNTDCINGLTCYRDPNSEIDGPGFCSVPCFPPNVALAVCGTISAGASAPFGCLPEDLACAFDCSSGSCPSGMECETAGGISRCQYPRGFSGN